MSFQTDKLIRFSHCDPAGIGFYPRYVELVAEVVEDWCHEGLGASYKEMLGELRLGLPTANLMVNFMVPSRMGDGLRFSLHVLHIGNSSLTLAISAGAEGQTRLSAEMTVVMVNLDTMKSVPISEEWREKFKAYTAGE